MPIKKHIIIKVFINIALLLTGVLLLVNTASAAQLTSRSLTLSNPAVSATNVGYTFEFDLPSNYILGSVVFEICVEDPLPNEPCTGPSGLNSGSLSIVSQSGETGFSINGNTTNNRIVLGRTPVLSTVTTLSYSLGSITNPDTAGSYFARLYTFSSNDGTGADIDNGGLAFSINNPLNINSEVPPYLNFCVGTTIAGLDCSNPQGAFLDLGELSSNTTKTATSQFAVSTNAESGAVIYAQGRTLTSGSNTIPALDPNGSSRQGVSQFGLNLRRNSSPSVGSEPSGAGAVNPNTNYNSANRYKFLSGEVLAAGTGPTYYRKFTVSYIVNVNSNQAPGVYNTTLTYICLANF